MIFDSEIRLLLFFSLDSFGILHLYTMIRFHGCLIFSCDRYGTIKLYGVLFEEKNINSSNISLWPLNPYQNNHLISSIDASDNSFYAFHGILFQDYQKVL